MNFLTYKLVYSLLFLIETRSNFLIYSPLKTVDSLGTSSRLKTDLIFYLEINVDLLALTCLLLASLVRFIGTIGLYFTDSSLELNYS